MAQELRAVNLIAPAFKGLNTEDSPLAQDPSFADRADNAVIDNQGRYLQSSGRSSADIARGTSYRQRIKQRWVLTRLEQ